MVIDIYQRINRYITELDPNFSYAHKIRWLTNKYSNKYYQIRKLLIYNNKLKKILKYYYLPDTFYKLYQLIKKRKPLELRTLIKEELLRNKPKEEVLTDK